MIGQHIRLGRISGIELGINWSVLAVFWLIAWSLAAVRLPAQYEGYGSVAYWIAGTATSLVFLASLLAHELGHALVARSAAVEVDGITLWLFGGVARLRGEAMNPRAELMITVVGPFVSVGLAVLFGALSFLLSGMGMQDLIPGVLRWLGVINATLAVFNLVPAFPLDGGRVLRAILWNRRADRLSATRTAAAAGRGFAYFLIGLGLVEFAAGASVGGLWFVFLGWFLLGAAAVEESQALLRGALRDLRVEDIMSREPVAAPSSLSIDSFIDDYVMTRKFATFPIEDDDGAVVGLATLSRAKDIPSDRRHEVRLSEIACPMNEVATVRPQDPAAEVLEGMQRCSDGRALVFDDGRLVGIVSPRDVQRALERVGLRGEPVPEAGLRS